MLATVGIIDRQKLIPPKKQTGIAPTVPCGVFPRLELVICVTWRIILSVRATIIVSGVLSGAVTAA